MPSLCEVANAAATAGALPVAFNRASPFAAAIRTTASSLVRRLVSAAGAEAEPVAASAVSTAGITR